MIYNSKYQFSNFNAHKESLCSEPVEWWLTQGRIVHQQRCRPIGNNIIKGANYTAMRCVFKNENIFHYVSGKIVLISKSWNIPKRVSQSGIWNRALNEGYPFLDLNDLPIFKLKQNYWASRLVILLRLTSTSSGNNQVVALLTVPLLKQEIRYMYISMY